MKRSLLPKRRLAQQLETPASASVVVAAAPEEQKQYQDDKQDREHGRLVSVGLRLETTGSPHQLDVARRARRTRSWDYSARPGRRVKHGPQPAFWDAGARWSPPPLDWLARRMVSERRERSDQVCDCLRRRGYMGAEVFWVGVRVGETKECAVSRRERYGLEVIVIGTRRRHGGYCTAETWKDRYTERVLQQDVSSQISLVELEQSTASMQVA